MKVLSYLIFGIGLVVLMALLMTFPVMWLVNYLFLPSVIHSLFGVWSFDFWHALWLSTLCSCLFKSSSISSKD